jgi:transcription antitermination factor NusG
MKVSFVAQGSFQRESIVVSELEAFDIRVDQRTDEQSERGLSIELADASLPWHAAYTRHQHEKVAARMLAYKGFEVFLPLYEAEHRWRDRTKKLSLPLFPCYLFFRGGLDRQLELLSTPGIYSVVRSGDQFADIPELEIQAVRQVVRTSARAEPYPFLKCGDLVRVISGPLTGVEGILVRKRDQFRLILSVDLLHRSIAVEVDAENVEFVRQREIKPELTLPSARSDYRLGVV